MCDKDNGFVSFLNAAHTRFSTFLLVGSGGCVSETGTDLTTVMQSSDIIQRLKDQFIEPVPSSMTIPFAEFVRNEIAFWEKTARSLNLYRTE